MFHAAVREWFDASFDAPTAAQARAWPAILGGKSTLLLAPTGSGKTLAAFLAAIERLMFARSPEKTQRLKVLYVSPLKALGVDVEKNLRAPLAGIAQTAERRGDTYRVPRIAVRSGDTPPKERARFSRDPADILITTPESLYLLLTSNAREVLRSVETVIVDEIHSMVPTKRGAHLFLSLERLQALCDRPLQRIGLSATQRPLAGIARLLAGGELDGDTWTQRPVEIIDAGSRRAVDLRVEVPVEDMAALGQAAELASGPAAAAEQRRSIWPSIHPRLVELVRQHRSTMIFANSRRLAERLAAAMNELAGEEIALAHHGSVAKEQRLAIEDRLKRGTLPAIVATSSLELGIDMGAVDLVIQIEAPPSVASGMQRVGRAGHSVGQTPKGVVFPKFRGDLLAAAAATPRMLAGQVEETLYPENPLDVLAQQLVAALAMDEWAVDDLFTLVRRAAPWSDLPRGAFDGVLDMLSGRYPSDEFAGLRARIVWDRVAGTARARQGARSIAVINGGTIPDRGLYGVFLAGAEEGKPVRVGELDEEMVFESRENEVFLLGASAWRIEEITHDRVLVTPAPGQPGKLPFWHGDRPGRPAELGAAVGKLARDIADDPDAASERLHTESKLDALAAQNLIAYVADQRAATGEVPSDRCIVIERFIDEMGDWRVCVLSPFGARVHAPWATAVTSQIRERTGLDVEVIWSDDGMVYRLPEADGAPDPSLFVPSPDAVEDQVVRALGGTALFAARFRENAARALLLPRRMPGKRSALWAQRKRAGDLLAVAARYGSFPILLETYRECLRDVFDVPALVDLLRQIESREIRVVTVDTRAPSPFAGTLLFSYVANFIYDGDAPLAERRAQALGLDHAQLRELLGSVELRELIDPAAVESLSRSLQHFDRPVKSEDGLHDLLLALGDLTLEEAGFRAGPASSLPAHPPPPESSAGGVPPVPPDASLRSASRSLRSGPLQGWIDRLLRAASRAGGAHRGRGALHRERGRGALSRRAGHRVAARAARGVPRAGRRRPRRSGVALRAHPRTVPRGRRRRALRHRGRAGADGAGAAAGSRSCDAVRRRRVVRRGGAARAQAPLARRAPSTDRAGRARGVRALPARMVQRDAPARRPRRIARRPRAARRRAARALGSRERHPARARPRLSPVGPGSAVGNRRGLLARRGIPRPERRARRAPLPGSARAARAAGDARRERAGQSHARRAGHARRVVLPRSGGGDRRVRRRCRQGAARADVGRRGHERHARAARDRCSSAARSTIAAARAGARGARCRPARRAAGRCCVAGRSRPTPSAARRWPTCCSTATACWCARRRTRRTSRAASRRCTRS